MNVVYKSELEKVWYCSWINRLPIFKLDTFIDDVLFEKRELCKSDNIPIFIYINWISFG